MTEPAIDPLIPVLEEAARKHAAMDPKIQRAKELARLTWNYLKLIHEESDEDSISRDLAYIREELEELAGIAVDMELNE